MARQYKLARKMKNVTLTTAAEALGVTQPSLSAWESGRKNPTIDNLVLMSEYYGVSADFLLGLSDKQDTRMDFLRPIPQKLLLALNDTPVYCEDGGWALVNAKNKELLFSDGRVLPISDAKRCYLLPPMYTVSDMPIKEPLHRSELSWHDRVWIEPISPDAELRNELRGWYRVKDRYVENQFGQRFFFDTYNAKWLAFEDLI